MRAQAQAAPPPLALLPTQPPSEEALVLQTLFRPIGTGVLHDLVMAARANVHTPKNSRAEAILDRTLGDLPRTLANFTAEAEILGMHETTLAPLVERFGAFTVFTARAFASSALSHVLASASAGKCTIVACVKYTKYDETPMYLRSPEDTTQASQLTMGWRRPPQPAAPQRAECSGSRRHEKNFAKCTKWP